MTIASIDIGSNTVLLLIAEANLQTHELIVLKNEQRLPRISSGLVPGGRISRESEKRLFTVLKEYFSSIDKFNCDKVLLLGTNAFRIASNSKEIKSKIRKEFNTRLNIISGKEEAALAFLGTMEYGNEDETRLVIDIGGGSTEIIYGSKRIVYSQSFSVGVVSLSETYFNKKKSVQSKLILMEEFLKKKFNMLPELLNAPDKVIGIAGTPVTLSCINKRLNLYDESKVEGSILNLKEVKNLHYHLSRLTPKEILDLYPSVVKSREDLILSGAMILLFIMQLLKIEEIIVSTKGIRYGAIFQYLYELNYK